MINLGRAKQHWEDTLLDLTPVESVSGMLFKREDKFAPLGYGAINGAKLRQLIWLVNRYKQQGGDAGLLSGASVHSPQLSMGTAVASHFGLPSTHVLGAPNSVSSLRHPDVNMAYSMGATFEYSKVGYNGALQAMVRRLLETEKYAGYFYLEYGVSLDHKQHPPEDIAAFHRVGAQQVQNLPDVNHLIVPAGSCNSLVSVLYGLALHQGQPRHIVLPEIGPSKRKWVQERLAAIQSVSGKNMGFDGLFERVEYHDLHGTGYVTYSDTRPYTHGSITFHNRYEGKVMTWLADRKPELIAPDNLLWVIAGHGSADKMRQAYTA